MEKKSEIKAENKEEVEEFELFGDDDKDNQNNNDKSIGLSDSVSKEESLTLEEYYLECARFGELSDLKEAMKDATKDFNVNLVDFGGNTALHLASANGFLDVVKYLINELHCDINAKNKSQSTPLSWAAFNGQKAVVEFLLEKGADFDIKNANGKKPSELAYDSGYYDVSDILLSKENEKYKGTIQEEKNEGFVSIINYRGRRGKKGRIGGPQLEVYYDCYEKNNKNYDWLSFYDVDEFHAVWKK